MKKRILFLIHDLQCGGAERVLVNLVNSLDEEKYDITVQSLFDVGILRRNFNDNINYIGGFKKMFRGNVTLCKLFTPKQLCKMLIKNDYDLAVSFLEGPCCRILSEYEGKKIAWIHIEHDSEESISRPFRSFDEAKNCYNEFDKIVCVAKTVEKNFNLFFNLEDKTQVIYNMIDKEAILEASEKEQDLIIPSDEYFNIVSVGRLVNGNKGFDRLIRIHNKLIDEGINNKLYIIGEGADRPKLEALIEDDNVVLTGFVENPYNLVRAADLFVCSSHKEGFSTAVTEALILGVPVISTDVSGARELINNGCGCVVSGDNQEQALYEEIKLTLSDKERLEEYKMKAQLRGTWISPEKTINQCEELFEL
ncbi:MAG: glycosyltransferase [Eubacterium sp.]|nr:glycosyltransferase [Eubacterium sp.]